MTIQRMYSLPNCKLILQGLSDVTSAPSNEVRPLLSMLVNVECHLAASTQPLTGGRDFFESLVTAVSAYAQEFLSKVHHPAAPKNKLAIVQLQKLDENRHRLIVHSEIKAQESEVGESSTPPPILIDLTTVQLFDLVEAVDQFFADSQTLPDLSLPLLPISKRVSSSQIITKQAVPATVGLSGLALAAVAFFFVPIPRVRPPQPQPQHNSSTTIPSTRQSNQINPSPKPSSSP